MVATALVILSDGTEETEAVILIDVLRRAHINVTVGGLQSSHLIKCANGIQLEPDVLLQSVALKLFDVVIMPGGEEGSEAMAKSALVGNILKAHANAKKYIAAICEAPVGLQAHGIYLGKKLICYPGFEGKLKGFTCVNEPVVQDDNLITIRGPGTTFALAIKLAELFVGPAQSVSLANGLLLNK